MTTTDDRGTPGGGKDPGETRPMVGLRGHRMLDPEKSASRRREILHAAAQVFGAKGFHASTMDDIAATMGLTKGMVYYYFRSKEEIFVEVVSTAIRGAQERLERVIAAGAPPAEMLRQAIAAHLAYNLSAEEEGYYAMLVINDLRRASDESRMQVRGLQRAYMSRFASIIERGVQEGVFAPRDAWITTIAILTTVNHASDWYRPAGRLSREGIIDHLADQLVAGVLATPGERPSSRS